MSRRANLIKGLLFPVPLVLLFGIPAVVLWLGGEFMLPSRIVLLQRQKPILYGPAYSNAVSYVKVAAIVDRKPEIIAVGTSRSLALRAEFFRPTTNFYNAGGTLARITHFRPFLDQIPDNARPAILIPVMDQYFFTTRFDRVERDALNAAWITPTFKTFTAPVDLYQSEWATVYRDMWQGKICAGPLLRRWGKKTRYGMNACFNCQGYRSDGSYRYGAKFIVADNPAHEDYQFRLSLSRIRNNQGRFVYDDRISPGAVAELVAFLDRCHERGIHVVSFLPPYPPTVFNEMAAHREHYGYFFKLYGTLQPLFAKRGFELYDFSDAGAFGSSDEEAVDGIHGSDKTYLRLFLAMLHAGSRLADYADATALEASLRAATSPRDVFPDVF